MLGAMSQNVDPETGELGAKPAVNKEHAEILTLALRRPVDLTTTRKIEEISGAMPPLFNLRDHAEFSGRAFTVARVKEAEGEFGYHLYLAGYLSASKEPNDEPLACIIRTGSEYVIARVFPAMRVINEEGQLFTGILRNEGRAWFLD